MKRKMTKPLIKSLDDALAGIRIKFELDKDLGDNKFRVNLQDIDGQA